MNNLRAWLFQYGLHETEVDVYLCIYSHPHSKTADIQKFTHLVRTTIYYSLAELKTKGLISENTQNNVRTYVAHSPEILKSSIDARVRDQELIKKQLDDLLPHLRSPSNTNTESQSYVARFEGEPAIKQAIDLALRCNSKRWHVLASHDNFLSHTTRRYKDYYLAERVKRNIISKTLWEPHDAMKTPSVKDTVFRNPRVLPELFHGSFNSLVILYDDVTLIINPYDDLSGHAIHDRSSTQLMRLLFTSLWESAPPARKN